MTGGERNRKFPRSKANPTSPGPMSEPSARLKYCPARHSRSTRVVLRRNDNDHQPKPKADPENRLRRKIEPQRPPSKRPTRRMRPSVTSVPELMRQFRFHLQLRLSRVNYPRVASGRKLQLRLRSQKQSLKTMKKRAPKKTRLLPHGSRIGQTTTVSPIVPQPGGPDAVAAVRRRGNLTSIVRMDNRQDRVQ